MPSEQLLEPLADERVVIDDYDPCLFWHVLSSTTGQESSTSNTAVCVCTSERQSPFSTVTHEVLACSTGEGVGKAWESAMTDRVLQKMELSDGMPA